MDFPVKGLRRVCVDLLMSDNMLANFKSLFPRTSLKRIELVHFVSIVMLGVFVLALAALYYFPLYPDEIQVRFWLSRLPYDFPQKISGAPTCLSTFCQTIPVTMYVPGIINWLLHGMIGTPPELRIVGMGVALLCVAALSIYINYRVEQQDLLPTGTKQYFRQRIYVTAFFVALFSVGVFPVFLILNRNEQLMLPSIAILIGLFVSSLRIHATSPVFKKNVFLVLYFISVSLVLYGHGKGLFFAPFFIVVGWQVFRRTYGIPMLVVGMGLLGFHLTQDYFALKFAFQCPEVPKLTGMFKSFALDPASLFSAPKHFLRQAYYSLLAFPKYLDQIGFQQYTDAAYLPSSEVSPLAKISNFFIKLNLTVIFFSLVVFLPFQYYRQDISRKRFATVNSALLVLLGCAVISAVFNIPKNWYDAGFIYALLLIILVFFVGENFPGSFEKPAARRIFLYVAGVALLSAGVFVHRTLPEFLNGYSGPSVPIVNYNSQKIQADIVAAAQACDIDIVNGKRLIVDDNTYLYLRKTRQPMAITYIWLGSNDAEIRQFLSKSDSAGLIVKYNFIIEPYSKVVKRVGSIGCISRADLKKLSSTP